jgi:disease resistance protein RPS2
MEAAVAASVVSAGAKPICDLLCDCVCSKIISAVKLSSNLDDLVRAKRSLLRRRIEVKNEVAKQEEIPMREEVKDWLQEVEELRPKLFGIQNQREPCFLNCCKRCEVSTEVDEILKKVQRLLRDGTFPDGVVDQNARHRVVHIPAPSIQSPTMSKNLHKVKEQLNNNKRMIGIIGMGGIGKSALVKILYNELINSTSHNFGIVIFATVYSTNSEDAAVPKYLDMKAVREQIAKRLNLDVKVAKEEDATEKLHMRLKNEGKFLLILDDVWEGIDLEKLGVPQPGDDNGFKIIITARDVEVCRIMSTDADVIMDVLKEEEAYQLFCEKAAVLNDENFRTSAKAIVKECCSLPLAIITMGASMRRKTEVVLWDDALRELQKPVPSIKRIVDKVFKPLKWSYDSLQDNKIKSCFLYCSLFPEDFSIEINELVQYWLAEGLIDEQQYYVDSISRGIALIKDLKDSCLLEDGAREGTVKMHDVVRDVAIWIASTSEDGCQFLVRSGIRLNGISVEEFSNSNSLKRVSFMNNKITSLPDSKIQCPKASTLLLQGNRHLKIVPERFLQGFVSLRVLNLSKTNIQSLPDSIMQLGDLRALLLRDCWFLGELPSLGELSKLEMLDLSGTQITELSQEMEKLSKLRRLDISHTGYLETIPAGIISKLSCLEVLDMTDSAYEFLVEGEITFKELGVLNRLFFLSISFKRIPHLSFEDLFWIKRLRGFQIFIDPKKGSSSVISTTNDKGVVSFGNVDISQGSVGQLWDIAKSLVLNDCRGLDEMLEDLVKSGGCFASLKSLAITGFDRRVRVNEGLAAQCDLLPNLEELTLSRLNALESISELVRYLGLRFPRLKLIKVSDCSVMRYLLSCRDFIQPLPELEVIEVMSCLELEELFNNDSRQDMALDRVVPKLRTLKLQLLPKLRSLCRHEETWPCLVQVEVLQCEQLRRLPLSSQNAGTI